MPTVSTLPFIKPHFHSNAGTPATGYKLYSYDATTQDEYPLYKDPAGTIEYSNPIILNSRGEPDGAGIYLDDDKVYKLILKTETNDPVWTVNAVQGVGGNGGVAVPIIPLPGHTVLGNATDNYGDAYAVEIVDTITDTTDINLVPSVGAVKNLTDGYLPNSGNNTYNGNLTVSGDINASNISVNGIDIDDIYVAKDGHNARSLVGNIDSESGAVEDIAIADTLTSGSANEIPSVAAVKSYVDAEVSDLEDQIAAIQPSGKVKVDATDIENYLENKLVEGNRVQITKIVDGGEEKLQLDLNLDDLKDIAYVFQAYGKVAGFDTVTNGAIYDDYESDPVNHNDAFDVTSGRFTCVDSGYYHFDAQALINQQGTVNASSCSMYIKHYDSTDVELGSSVAFATTPADVGSHPAFTVSCSANFHLGVGDYVGIVFDLYDNGTTPYVNKVGFGGYSLDSASGALGSGTPNRLAWYDHDGVLNPNANLKYTDSHSILLGDNNTDTEAGGNNVLIGSNNTVNTNEGYAFGTNNNLYGSSSTGKAYAIGNDNDVHTSESFAVGSGNVVGNTYGGKTVAVGVDNNINGAEVIGFGQDLVISGAYAVASGENISGDASNKTVVGKNITLDASSIALGTIIGYDFDEADMPVNIPTGIAVGSTNDKWLSFFGKYVDQFGTQGTEGALLGFDSNNKIKVTNTVTDIQFLTNTEITPTEGQLAWNTEDKTLNLGLAGGSILQLGEEELVYANNRTGTTINNGEVVYVSGSQGNRVVISRAQAVTTPTNQVFIAVATQSIAKNQMGYFTRFGLIRDINTAAYLEGDILWVSTTAGQMTSVQPSKPYSQIAVAIVTRAHAVNGIIMVSPYVVPRIGQLTDVDTTGATDGQALVYQASTGLWIPGTATGGVSDGKIKVTAGDTADYAGTKFTSTDNTVDITVNTGSIDLSVDVGTVESKFATNPTSTSTSGTVNFTGFEFGNWTVSNGNVIAPSDISGTHQINLIGKILYATENDGSQAFYADSQGASYSNINNYKMSWNSLPFGTWNDNYNRVTVLESGKLLINWGFTIHQNTTAGLIAYLSVNHYASNGTLKKSWQLNGAMSGVSVSSAYDYYSDSRVINVTGGDYFECYLSVIGSGFVNNVSFSGGLLSNIHDSAGNTTPVFLNHKSSTGTIKSSIVAYEGSYPFNGFKSFTISKTYEIEEGDSFYVTFYPGSNVSALVEVILSGAIMQSNTVGGGGTVDATLDGIQSYALIMTNGSISTGHTSDQGSTYTSARVIPAALVEANYISCFATQIGTYYGLRMGIYTPGPSGDTLIAQTDNLTTTPSTGIITLPLVYDAAGNALTEPLVLQPNASYMLAAVIKANACNFASYTGISTNPPNHFGRKDDWNAQSPITNLMPVTAGFSQTNTFLWMSVSK